jgi:uncharacterized 2Fe-2S/4Fe-4S cluster protein (DUF4445 family)
MTVDCPEEENLLESLRGRNIYVPGVCGGTYGCGKCRVRVLEGFLEVTGGDARHLSIDELENGWRLACLARPTQNLVIEAVRLGEENFRAVTEYDGEFFGAPPVVIDEMPFEKSAKSVTERVCGDHGEGGLTMEVLRDCSGLVEGGFKTAYIARSGGRVLHVGGTRRALYAIAVDIGTTTLCLSLVNVVDGTVLGCLSSINDQRRYGMDVISRIMRAAQGELPVLSGLIRTQIAREAEKLCAEHGVDHGSVVKMAIAGNTVMLHLLLGLSCRTLGVYPFTPVTLSPLSLRYDDIFDGCGVDFSCQADILPGISTYVGADISAGILFTDLIESERPAVLLDMGTNGEMALSRDGMLYCAAAAAGPAFEGGNIQWGTGSVPGAISSVRFEGDVCRIDTIGGAPPVGICGSGVIDATAECLTHGFILPNGRFERNRGGRVVLGATNAGEEIVFTQKDIREVQLGKSAIRSGMDVLMRAAGLQYGDIGEFYVAGGFGSSVNTENGAAIGLFPAELSGKMRAVGNSALGGLVKYLLDDSAPKVLDAITRNAKEFSLSEDKSFNRMFIDNMSFVL